MDLSIVVPMYSVEKYIEKCIVSLITFQNDNYEIILVNDGSKDETLKIARQYEEQYDKIKVIDIPNGGVSNARNIGIKNSSGKYIMFVDSDDYLSDEWHEIIDRGIKTDNDYVIYSDKIYSKLDKKGILKYILGYNTNGIVIGGPFCKLIKREIIINNKIEFEKGIISGEDMLFNLECLKYSKTYTILNETFYKYLIRAGSATNSYNEKSLESDKKFHNKLKEILMDIDFIDDDEKLDIQNTSLKNAIVMMFLRGCHLRYGKFKKSLEFIKLNPYREAINYKLKLGRKKDLILNLIKIKMFLIGYILVRLKKNKKIEQEFYVDM